MPTYIKPKLERLFDDVTQFESKEEKIRLVHPRTHHRNYMDAGMECFNNNRAALARSMGVSVSELCVFLDEDVRFTCTVPQLVSDPLPGAHYRSPDSPVPRWFPQQLQSSVTIPIPKWNTLPFGTLGSASAPTPQPETLTKKVYRRKTTPVIKSRKKRPTSDISFLYR